jgi:spore germination cell wall hydrolase CwlJ-like protein
MEVIMKSKSRKTAVLSVIILLLIMQLAFLNERKHEDNKTSIQLAERNVQDTSVSDKDAAYTEEIISTELNVVYRNTSSLKDISQEMEESKEKSSYDNKVVSYTLEELIIYSEPDLKSEPVGIMYSGSEADVLERGEEWSKIQSGKVTGYIRNVDVLFDSEAEVIASVIGNKQAKVNADLINVYAEADDSAAVISTLEKGAEIDAYEENGNYTLISCDNGFGYISNDSFDVSYNLSKAVSMAEIEAIKEEERAEAARKAAEEAAAQATAAQNAIKQQTTTRGAYTVSAEELHLLAAIIYWESGWEPSEGQLAVANVVLNRVFSSRFSQNTITSVVYAPGQFSGVSENGVPSARFQAVLNKSNEELNLRGCYDSALKALAGENNIGDLLFFINVKKADFTKYKGYTIVNNHCFYTY